MGFACSLRGRFPMQRDYPYRSRRDRPWRGERGDDLHLWGREMNHEDWERGTYGSTDPEYRRAYQPPAWDRAEWQHADWQEPDWRARQGSRGYRGQDREGWQRSPNYDYQRYPDEPGDEPRGGPYRGWREPRGDWGRGWGQDWWAHPPTRELHATSWQPEPWRGAEPEPEPWDRTYAERQSGRHWHGRTELRGWRRSDERIREDVCMRLADHPGIDTSDLDVSVHDGEVTLEGNVDDRFEKRLAEDLAEEVPGVRDVHNRLRTHQGQSPYPRSGQSSGAERTHLRTGMQVVGVDGNEIGHVKELRGDQF